MEKELSSPPGQAVHWLVKPRTIEALGSAQGTIRRAGGHLIPKCGAHVFAKTAWEAWGLAGLMRDGVPLAFGQVVCAMKDA